MFSRTPEAEDDVLLPRSSDSSDRHKERTFASFASTSDGSPACCAHDSPHIRARHVQAKLRKALLHLDTVNESVAIPIKVTKYCLK